jgi:hypothetical protein
MKKNLAIAALIGVPVLAMIVVIMFQHFDLKKANEDLQLAKLELAVQNDTIISFRTRDSTLVSKIRSIEIDRDNLKDALEEMGLDRKKLRDQKIKLQDVISVLQIKLEASGHVETVIRDTIRIEKSDTIKIGRFKWSNKFLFINGSIEDKDINFDYLYQTKISNVQDQNRKGTTVSLVLSDPKARITNGASFAVIHKKSLLEKWWITVPVGIMGGILISK